MTPPTGVTDKTFAQQWKTDQGPGLDATGNWTDFWHDTDGQGWNLKQQREHNEANEITDITETTGTVWPTPVHDAAGNMTSAPRPNDADATVTLKYDAWNRLVAVDLGEDPLGNYEYDGLGRRTLAMPDFGATTYWMHEYWNSSWQLLEMRSNTNDAAPESSGVARQLIWSARYIDALVWEKVWANEHYFLGDANFNITTAVTTSGDAREHYQYEPYGAVRVLNGGTPDTDGDEWTNDPNLTSDISNHFLYTGRWEEYQTRLYYYRHRYYHPRLARFTSRDPIGYQLHEPNLFRYVVGNPTKATDPYGLKIMGLNEHDFKFEVARGGSSVYTYLVAPSHPGAWGQPFFVASGGWSYNSGEISTEAWVKIEKKWSAKWVRACNTISGSWSQHGGSLRLLLKKRSKSGTWRVTYYWRVSLQSNNRPKNQGGGTVTVINAEDKTVFQGGPTPSKRSLVKAGTDTTSVTVGWPDEDWTMVVKITPILQMPKCVKGSVWARAYIRVLNLE